MPTRAATSAGVRRVIRDLRPIYLEDLGLAPALEMLVQSLHAPEPLEAVCTISGEPRRLAPECELAVYRIVQEALNNVVKHAQARHVQVQVRFAAVVYSDFPTVEWTVQFTNTGTNDSAILSDIQGLDTAFERVASPGFVLHHHK